VTCGELDFWMGYTEHQQARIHLQWYLFKLQTSGKAHNPSTNRHQPSVNSTHFMFREQSSCNPWTTIPSPRIGNGFAE
jgi:hypothetical protein